MKTQTRVVAIGGGIAGCSTLYHLPRDGWTDVVLIERPELQRARATVAMLFDSVHGWPERDQRELHASMVEEYVFHHAFRAANCDPNLPEVARFMVPAHRWFGRDVPGSRWAGDSPDFTYRTIPIAHGGSYEIHGRATCAEPPISFWSLMSRPTAEKNSIGPPGRSRCARSCSSIGTSCPSWRRASISPDQRTTPSGSSMMSATNLSTLSLAGSQLRPTRRPAALREANLTHTQLCSAARILW